MDDVIVKVRGEQTGADGEKVAMELVAEGHHYRKGLTHYVVYDDNVTDEATSTILKISPQFMVLTRSGGITQEQHFQKNVISRTEYATPFGSMELAVKTDQIDIVYGTVSGEINVSYEMAVNGEWMSDNALHIEVNAADKSRLH